MRERVWVGGSRWHLDDWLDWCSTIPTLCLPEKRCHKKHTAGKLTWSMVR